MKLQAMKKLTLLTALATLFASLLTACTEETAPESRLRPVKHITVQSGAGAIRDRVFSGTAQSSQEADLSFKVSGTVKRVAVKVGDQLNRGDLIAELDTDTYRVELEQARAATAQSNAARRNAESEYRRVRQLYTNDNASRNELDSALADAESAKAAHNADEQSLRLAQLNLDYTRLVAEADCSVAALDIEPNENASSGQTVAQVSCGDGWEIDIAVPESLIALFQNGMPGSVQFTSVPGQAFKGRVTEVGVGTGDSTTFPVTLTLDQAPTNIRSNLAAEVTFQFANQNVNSTVFYVPSSAVLQDQNGTFVYVMEASDTPNAASISRRGVQVGEISSLGLQVLSGLVNGDRVLVAGQINAREGMLVRDSQ